MNSRAVFVFIFSVYVACGGSQTPAPNAEVSQSQSTVEDDLGFPFAQPTPGIYAGRQPTEAELALANEMGVRTVISLREASEGEAREPEVIEKLGMKFERIPVAGAVGVTFDNASTLHAAIEAAQAEGPVLVHCGSGNRVGALVALQSFEDGAEEDAAIAEGKRWGLTKLESVVRGRIADSCTASKRPNCPAQ